MKFFTILSLLFITFPSFAYELESLGKDVDFKIEIDKVTEEQGFVAVNFMKPKDFLKTEISKLDTRDLNKLPDTEMIVMKAVGLIPSKTLDDLSLELFTTIDFLEHVLQKTSVEETAAEGVFRFDKEFGLGDIVNLGKIQLDAVIEDMPLLSSEVINAATSVDSELGMPEKLLVIQTENGSKLLNGNSLFVKGYRVKDNQTLFILYIVSSAKKSDVYGLPAPNFIIRKTIRSEARKEAKHIINGVISY